MSRTIKLDEDERERLVADIEPDFPKYTTQIMNPANQNAQGTRPKVVGQMSELVEEYKEKYPDGGYEEWEQFYLEECNGEERIEEATAPTKWSRRCAMRRRKSTVRWFPVHRRSRPLQDLHGPRTPRGDNPQEAIQGVRSGLHSQQFCRRVEGD